MAATLKDVAELAGVSRSAVSRTFTEGASVSKSTRKKVMDAASRLNYQPNLMARGVSTGRTKLIGLVANNFLNPIFLEVFDRFTRCLQDRGLRPLLVNLTDATDPANSVNLLTQYRVDGVIVASSTLPPKFSKAFAEAGLPVVHTFGRFNPTPLVHTVGIDNKECGRIAAKALLRRGYKHVGYIGGPDSATSAVDRFEGFKEVIEAQSDVVLRTRFAAAYTHSAGRLAMIAELSDTPAQAYFCGDDVISIGAMAAIEHSGRLVPDDIGLIGLNDMEIAAWENINLTTIHQPVGEIVKTSVDLIAQLLDDPKQSPQATLFPCHLVERGTLK